MFLAHEAHSEHPKPHQIEVSVLKFLPCLVSEKASNARVFFNLLTGGTSAQVGPLACPSSEEKLGIFAPVG